jgi:hypothetical protein
MADEIAAWDQAEKEMAESGYSLDKIPNEMYLDHIWADGLLLWWHKHKKLPTAWELASDMFDEWDDPVSVEEAEEILKCLTG